MTPSRLRLMLVALYVVAVGASCAFSEAKRTSLAYQQRDYPFYLQFATKLLDPAIAPKAYTINPDGYNFLFVSGTEGVASFHQSLHIEPLKYLGAVAYRAANDFWALYAFMALVYFLPVLYLAYALTLKDPLDCWFALVVALLYVVFPSSFKAPSFDLRPYIFLTPMLTLAMLSILCARPRWEVALLFCGMFFAREEALVLGAAIIAYSFVREADAGDGWRAARPLVQIWAFWLVVTAAYFWWTGYSNNLLPKIGPEYASLTHRSPVVTGALVVGGLAGLAGVLAGAWLLVRMNVRRHVREVLAYSLMLPPFLFQLVREKSDPLASLDASSLAATAFAPRWALLFVALLILLVMAWGWMTHPRQRRAVLAGAGLALAAAAAVTVFSPFGIAAQWRRLEADHAGAVPVLALRQATDKHTARILTDFTTYQAFADYQYVYVYNRLPWQVVPGDGRRFPENADVLGRLLREDVEYVVMSPESWSKIVATLPQGTVKSIAPSGRFMVARLR